MSQTYDDMHGLSPEDARILDLLVDNGFDPDGLEGLNAEERRRAGAIMGLFGLIDDYPVDDADDALVDVTLARIRRVDEVVHSPLARIDGSTGDEESTRRRIRMPDLLSLAAVVLIVASVAWPIVGAVRQRSIDAACVANLTALGEAFSLYASDHDGQVPMVTAGYGGNTGAQWVDPLPLIRAGYCEHGHADCPGHPGRSGYSRQLVPVDGQFPWTSTSPATAVLGDRNPLIDGRQSGWVVSSTANSESHNGRGQNILMRDASTRWLEMPVIDAEDNIWLPRGQREFEFGQVPDRDGDIFLAH